MITRSKKRNIQDDSTILKKKRIVKNDKSDDQNINDKIDGHVDLVIDDQIIIYDKDEYVKPGNPPLDSKYTQSTESESETDTEASSEANTESSSESDSAADESDYENDPLKELIKKSYFTPNTSKLETKITEKINQEFPGLPLARLSTVVKQVFSNVKDMTMIEYCEPIPKDESWKEEYKKQMGNSDDIDVLAKELADIRSKMESDKPTLHSILLSKISNRDKTYAIKLFDVLQNTIPFTHEYIEIESCIKKLMANVDNINDIGTTQDADIIKIVNLSCSQEIKNRLIQMHKELINMSIDNPEYSKMKSKFIFATSLPYEKIIPYPIDKNSPRKEIGDFLKKCRENLDKDLYGLDIVKTRLLQFVNNRIFNPNFTSIMCFKSKPGYGKTSIAKSLANALNLPFERISLGGISDISTLCGSDQHYLGSSPGLVLKCIKNMQVSNGILLLDELDKISSKNDSEVESCLLNILDYNHPILQDLYISEFSHDLSRIFFIVTINDDSKLHPALRDRLDIIEIPDYKVDDLIKIMTNYMLPKILKNIGLEKDHITLTNYVCEKLLVRYKSKINSCGLRTIEKVLYNICSKLNLAHVMGTSFKGVDSITFPCIIDENLIYQLIDDREETSFFYIS